MLQITTERSLFDEFERSEFVTALSEAFDGGLIKLTVYENVVIYALYTNIDPEGIEDIDLPILEALDSVGVFPDEVTPLNIFYSDGSNVFASQIVFGDEPDESDNICPDCGCNFNDLDGRCGHDADRGYTESDDKDGEPLFDVITENTQKLATHEDTLKLLEERIQLLEDAKMYNPDIFAQLFGNVAVGTPRKS